jgi:hypothetical protein
VRPTGRRRFATSGKAADPSAGSTATPVAVAADSYGHRWLKAHGEGEKTFAEKLRQFFQRFAGELAAEVESDPTTTAFKPQQFIEELQAVVGDGLTDLAMTGAARELDHVHAAAAGSGFALPNLSECLPDLHGEIQHWLAGTMSEPWWSDTADDVRADLAEVLRLGIDTGESGRETAERVRIALGASGKVRADRIARTEVAGGLNFGHDATRKVLVAKTGIALKKQWLCVRDNWTRESHLEVDGQEVQAGDQFTVGGERCDYPGDRKLSAEERIHCRCTSITVGIEAAFADG